MSQNTPSKISEDDDQRYWRVAIVEDHLLHRRRTEDLIAAQSGLRVVSSCETLVEFVDWLRNTDVRSRPHILILDLVVDRGRDADPALVRQIVDSGIRVLVFSAMASVPLVRSILRSGVSGIVGKRDSEDDVIAAIWAVLKRGQWITPELANVMATDSSRPALSDQEERALILYASGLSLDAVAAALNVKRETAKTYLERVKRKYAAAGRPVRTKVDLHREALRDSLIDPLDKA